MVDVDMWLRLQIWSCHLWGRLGIAKIKKDYYIYCLNKCFDSKKGLVDPLGAEIHLAAQGDI
jgi:hypothetical protein